MKLATHVEIDMEDFAIGLSYQEALGTIKIIDSEQQCANFTFEVAVYFVKEVMKFAEDTEWTNELKAILESK